jgi:ADP-ribose pyrophosphatase
VKIVSSKQVYDCGLFRVTEDHARDTSGFEIKRSVVRHDGSAVVMAVEKGRLLLVRQYRLPADKYLWEIPAGRLDPGETPLQAARRELTEETGYVAKSWKKMVSWWPSPGFLAEKMTLFLASDLTAGEAQPAGDERIDMRWFSKKDLDAMVRSGKIEDGKTLIAFHLWTRLGRSVS